MEIMMFDESEIVQDRRVMFVDPWDMCEIPMCGRETEINGLCYEHCRVYEERIKESASALEEIKIGGL
jgi:hypothetical protein